MIRIQSVKQGFKNIYCNLYDNQVYRIGNFWFLNLCSLISDVTIHFEKY